MSDEPRTSESKEETAGLTETAEAVVRAYDPASPGGWEGKELFGMARGYLDLAERLRKAESDRGRIRRLLHWLEFTLVGRTTVAAFFLLLAVFAVVVRFA